MLAEYWEKTAELIYLYPFAGRAIVLFWSPESAGLNITKTKNTAQKNNNKTKQKSTAQISTNRVEIEQQL